MAIRRTDPVNIVQSWDDAEKAFKSLRIDIATTSLAGGNAASKAFEIALDGVVVYSIDKNGVARRGTGTSSVVAVTAATLTVTQAAHAGKIVTLDRATGVAVTLLPATGTGDMYRFYIITAISGGSGTIKVADATDIMQGLAITASDGSTSEAKIWKTGATDDTITLDGSTTGGTKGALVELIDLATDLWSVKYITNATGTEATPFSATV